MGYAVVSLASKIFSGEMMKSICIFLCCLCLLFLDFGKNEGKYDFPLGSRNGYAAEIGSEDLGFFDFLTQEKLPDFAPPVKIPMQLSGNFAELRPNHFHGGIDIRTNGQTGLPVYAVADGYVSRISISPTGYGQALYVSHPCGYTSVYGHLESFSPELRDWVRSMQYEKNSYSINLFPSKDQFPVKKGQEIAKSGNSGGSGGPHLHFEVRETHTECPVNPLLLGFKVPDSKAPVVRSLWVYPLSDDSHVSGCTVSKGYDCALIEGVFRIKGNPTLTAYGKLGFGVDAIDYLDANWSKCGVFQIKIWVDSTFIYGFKLDKLDYENMRSVNSHVDYAKATLGGRRFHKNYVEPGNLLDIYDETSYRGIYNFNDGKLHKVTYQIDDAAGNRSKLIFSIQAGLPKKHAGKKCTAHFRWNERNEYKTDDFEVVVPKGNLYDDMNFNYRHEKFSDANLYSDLHFVGDEGTPIHNRCSIMIKADRVPERLLGKAVIGKYSPASRSMSSLGGSCHLGWMETTSSTFGTFAIGIDTIKPSIRPLSIESKNKLTEPNRIRFVIKDDLSGIASYEGFVDGKWVLFEYDAKSHTIVYNFDNHLIRGKRHTFLLEVKDNVNNIGKYEASFYK